MMTLKTNKRQRFAVQHKAALKWSLYYYYYYFIRRAQNGIPAAASGARTYTPSRRAKSPLVHFT